MCGFAESGKRYAGLFICKSCKFMQACALCSNPEKGLRPLVSCKSCKCVYAHPVLPNRQNVVALLFTCKSSNVVQAHPFFPNRNRGYARLLACKSCKLVQACRFSRDGKRGMPASLHAGLANSCRCTPFLPKRGHVWGVRPLIYMPVLQIGAGIPLVSSSKQ